MTTPLPALSWPEARSLGSRDMFALAVLAGFAVTWIYILWQTREECVSSRDMIEEFMTNLAISNMCLEGVQRHRRGGVLYVTRADIEAS